jgi:hypothetical protein
MRTKEYEGVDLYRTEIFLIARGTLTTEDEQHRLYQDLLECLAHSCTEIDLPTRQNDDAYDLIRSFNAKDRRGL